MRLGHAAVYAIFVKYDEEMFFLLGTDCHKSFLSHFCKSRCLFLLKDAHRDNVSEKLGRKRKGRTPFPWLIGCSALPSSLKVPGSLRTLYWCWDPFLGILLIWYLQNPSMNLFKVALFRENPIPLLFNDIFMWIVPPRVSSPNTTVHVLLSLIPLYKSYVYYLKGRLPNHCITNSVPACEFPLFLDFMTLLKHYLCSYLVPIIMILGLFMYHPQNTRRNTNLLITTLIFTMPLQISYCALLFSDKANDTLWIQKSVQYNRLA